MSIATKIDHTLLNPFASEKDLIRVVEECKQYGFHSLCISPYHASQAKALLKESTTKVCTVIGFPHGNNILDTKLEQIEALNSVVDEFDVVINLQALFSDSDLERTKDYLRNEIAQIVNQVHQYGKVVKFIIESSCLDAQQKSLLCSLFNETDVDFVKTSTGFNGAGAQLEDVAYLRSHLRDDIKIKASGGIKTLKDAVNMIEKGADRLGCSSSVQIVKQEK